MRTPGRPDDGQTQTIKPKNHEIKKQADAPGPDGHGPARRLECPGTNSQTGPAAYAASTTHAPDPRADHPEPRAARTDCAGPAQPARLHPARQPRPAWPHRPGSAGPAGPGSTASVCKPTARLHEPSAAVRKSSGLNLVSEKPEKIQGRGRGRI